RGDLEADLAVAAAVEQWRADVRSHAQGRALRAARLWTNQGDVGNRARKALSNIQAQDEHGVQLSVGRQAVASSTHAVHQIALIDERRIAGGGGQRSCLTNGDQRGRADVSNHVGGGERQRVVDGGNNIRGKRSIAGRGGRRGGDVRNRVGDGNNQTAATDGTRQTMHQGDSVVGRFGKNNVGVGRCRWSLLDRDRHRRGGRTSCEIVCGGRDGLRPIRQSRETQRALIRRGSCRNSQGSQRKGNFLYRFGSCRRHHNLPFERRTSYR